MDFLRVVHESVDQRDEIREGLSGSCLGFDEAVLVLFHGKIGFVLDLGKEGKALFFEVLDKIRIESFYVFEFFD